jgi:hypothetical protein
VKRRLSDFDMEKDEWYYQEKVYINPKSADSLYNELKEFRQSLTKEMEDGVIADNFKEILTMDEPEEAIKKLKVPERIEAPEGIKNRPEALNSRGFFDEKLKILKDEIEDINRNLEERKLIEKTAADSIESEIKEVKRQLHEIYTWKQGEKSTIEFIRMEFLKQLASLNREKRQSNLEFWKDRVFEKKDRRNMLMEYKSLDWMGALSKKKGKEKKQ